MKWQIYLLRALLYYVLIVFFMNSVSVNIYLFTHYLSVVLLISLVNSFSRLGRSVLHSPIQFHFKRLTCNSGRLHIIWRHSTKSFLLFFCNNCHYVLIPNIAFRQSCCIVYVRWPLWQAKFKSLITISSKSIKNFTYFCAFDLISSRCGGAVSYSEQ